MAESKTFKNLKTLNLNDNSIGDEGAKILAATNHLSQLEKLTLEENQIGPIGAKALAESTSLQNLAHPIFVFH